MPVTIRISTNASRVSNELRTIFSDQLPFAMSLTLNALGRDVREAQRAHLDREFTIRRRWVVHGIRVSKWSRKNDLETIVEVDPKRRFLFIHERGGIKRPRGSRLAIPDEVRRAPTQVIPRHLRPRRLQLREHGRGPRARVLRGQRRTFAIFRHGGGGGIFQRFGRRGATDVRTLFTFAQRARIDPRLGFEDTARRTVAGQFQDRFDEAFSRAIGTAR